MKVLHSLPLWAKLFQDKTQEFFDISVWDEGEVRNSTFAQFKRDKYAHDIIAASMERYMSKFLKPLFQYSFVIGTIIFLDRILTIFFQFSFYQYPI